MIGRSTRSALDEMRARHALREAGLRDDVPLERASSVTNESWLTPHFAVRVNRHPTQRLRREASLSGSLPPEAGYPGVVAHGGRSGADWLITTRANGHPLSRWWTDMTDESRRSAIHQLAYRLKAIHETTPPPDVGDTPSPQLVSGCNASPVVPLLNAIEELRRHKYVDKLLLERAANFARQTGSALDPWDDQHLIHGDVHFENLMWDGFEITAFLDFEYARPGPPDLDLDILLRCCAYPGMHVAPDYEDTVHRAHFVNVIPWMAEAYPELFADPRLMDRARLYSIGFDLNDLRSHPPSGPFAQLPEQHPMHRLERTLNGEGYVADLLGQISVA